MVSKKTRIHRKPDSTKQDRQGQKKGNGPKSTRQPTTRGKKNDGRRASRAELDRGRASQPGWEQANSGSGKPPQKQKDALKWGVVYAKRKTLSLGGEREGKLLSKGTRKTRGIERKTPEGKRRYNKC